MIVIDGVVQHACTVDWKQIRGAEDIVFEGWEKKSEISAGLLPNLGRAEARNYFLDLMCDLPPQWVLHRDFSDRLAGCWQWSMGKSVRWKTFFR